MVYVLEETIDSLTQKLGEIYIKKRIRFESDGYKDDLGVYKGSASIPFILDPRNPATYRDSIEEFLKDHGEYMIGKLGEVYGFDDIVATLRRADEMKDGFSVFREPGNLSFSYMDELIHQFGYIIETFQAACAFLGMDFKEETNLPRNSKDWLTTELDEDSRTTRAFILDEARVNAARYGNKRNIRRFAEFLTIDITYGAHGILYVITDNGDGFGFHEMVETHDEPGYTTYQPKGVKRNIGGNFGDGTRKTHLTKQVIASYQFTENGFASLIYVPFNNEDATPNP